MARVNVEKKALSDWRMKRMAQVLKTRLTDVYGSLLFVWDLCQEKRSVHLSRDEIDGAADRDGFAAAMLACSLGVEEPEGVRIAGMNERLEDLADWDDRCEKAWTRSAEVRKGRNKAKRAGKRASEHVGSVQESEKRAVWSGLVSGLGSGEDKDKDPEEEKITPASPVVVSDHSRFRAAWQAAWSRSTGNPYPSWGAKEGAQVNRLLKKPGGLEEALMRMRVLVEDPPPWLAKGGGSPSLNALEANWDALAVPGSQSRDPTRANGVADRALSRGLAEMKRERGDGDGDDAGRGDGGGRVAFEILPPAPARR